MVSLQKKKYYTPCTNLYLVYWLEAFHGRTAMSICWNSVLAIMEYNNTM